MSLEVLNEQVKKDLSYLGINLKEQKQPVTFSEGHVYDVIIIGSGQGGLGTAFGLLRERISNILVIDENKAGFEGPWDTYARMVTLRTPKHLTSIDLGIPSLTFRSYWVAQFGEKGWEAIDKIPRVDWMNYLRWYRNVLNLPVINEVKLTLIEPLENGKHKLHITGNRAPSQTLLARKVILATGIQGGGEWRVPKMISENLPSHLYSHSSKPIDFSLLKGKKIAILGGGASAFDNANYALSEKVSEAHVFVRRKELPRINPIRQMEGSGLIECFYSLPDQEKYEVMSHFFINNQPPTNDTYDRAASWPGFCLHLSSPWLDVKPVKEKVEVTTPKGKFLFDFLIISTGLITNPALRPELSLIEKHIARWSDRYQPPNGVKNPLLDAHPYLSSGFCLQSKDEAGKKRLYGLFTYNYSALISCGIVASALSGMKFGIPRLVTSVSEQLFHDARKEILDQYFTYKEPEFISDLKNSVSSS
ncbi:monooxygenase [Bacillus sp. SA1-12]|uniref:NAD(P)-binding domain-containing protein n=1 Tax=Bacillus sp. SA1-12 TaxID=1455638 RepID=UPI00062741BD|nr:NAD(P)/FAD-dependent oxidoreductase [Bacillus sp. SA1-12]KKI90443.1 monooxygenase [Bacillus sp. SA1-12]